MWRMSSQYDEPPPPRGSAEWLAELRETYALTTAVPQSPHFAEAKGQIRAQWYETIGALLKLIDDAGVVAPSAPAESPSARVAREQRRDEEFEEASRRHLEDSQRRGYV